MRACADDVDRAALVGIPVRRVHSIVWVIASVLGVPRRVPPRRHRRPLDRHRARAVAPAPRARGRGDRSHGTAPDDRGRGDRRSGSSSSRCCGAGTNPATCTRSCSSWWWSAVWLTPAGAGLRGRLEPSTWRAVREARPVPRELARLPEVRTARARARRRGGRVALALVPVVFTESRTNLAAVAVVYGDHRVVVGRPHRVGGRDQPRADGVRGGRRRGGWRRLTARLGWDLALGLAGRGRGRRRTRGARSACPCCDGAG